MKSGYERMEKTDKPLTRDALVSMQVIDSKGHSVGKVKDVCFQVGKYGISLAVESEDGELRTVEEPAAGGLLTHRQPHPERPDDAAANAGRLCRPRGSPREAVAGNSRGV